MVRRRKGEGQLVRAIQRSEGEFANGEGSEEKYNLFFKSRTTIGINKSDTVIELLSWYNVHQ